MSLEEITKANRFLNQMLHELSKNQHKGSILNWKDFDNIITELEYHKSKMFMAIRAKNPSAIKEYIADTANILLALGNVFDLYDADTVESETCFELNKELMFVEVSVNNQSKNQSII